MAQLQAHDIQAARIPYLPFRGGASLGSPISELGLEGLFGFVIDGDGDRRTGIGVLRSGQWRCPERVDALKHRADGTPAQWDA